MSGLLFRFFFLFLMKILVANNVDPDQIPHNEVSDLGLHCFAYDPLMGFQVRIGQGEWLYFQGKQPPFFFIFLPPLSIELGQFCE